MTLAWQQEKRASMSRSSGAPTNSMRSSGCSTSSARPARCNRVGGRARYRQDAAAAGTRGSCGAARAPRPLGVGVGARARAAVSVFVDALDEYVESLDPNLLSPLRRRRAELAHVLPSLSALAAGRAVALQHERYRSHRAVRVLLECLAQTRPLVLVLDDFHWADPGSVELLGALLRRPPAAAVLTAVALRPRLRSVLQPPSSGRVVRRC